MKLLKTSVFILLAAVFAAAFVACGEEPEKTQLPLSSAKEAYVHSIQSADVGSIAPEFAGFRLADESALEALKSAAMDAVLNAATQESADRAYGEFVTDAKELVHGERAKYTRGWEIRFDEIKKQMKPLAENEKLFGEIFTEITGKASYDDAHNAGLVELLKLRLYATTVKYDSTPSKNIVLTGAMEIGSLSVVGYYGDESVVYDYYSDCGGMYYGESKDAYTIKGVPCGGKVKLMAGGDYYTGETHYMAVARKADKIVGYALFMKKSEAPNTITVTKSELFADMDDVRYLESVYASYCTEEGVVETRRDENNNYLFMNYGDKYTVYELHAENALLTVVKEEGASLKQSGEGAVSVKVGRGEWVAVSPKGEGNVRVVVTVKNNDREYMRIVVSYTVIDGEDNPFQSAVCFGQITSQNML